MTRHPLAVAVSVATLGLAACGDDGPTATFDSPNDGAAVAGGVALAMSAEGVTIEPAGEVRNGFGHFHVIADAGCETTGTGIGKDADHLHFGGGQAAGTIYLEPGQHELCLQVGDGVHAALDITDTVTVDVGVTSQEQWCAVLREIDAMFETTDSSSDVVAQQLGYENIRRLVAQAADGLEYVDASARNDVTRTIEFAATLTSVLATAESEEAAEEELEALFADVGDEPLPGADWVLATCGIDIG
ncbi:MAG: DUF4399 domain-containing protein [Ilumatobacter sp.]|nr:DUF4399 domain-containing protein [Ilumatobacter sp.]